jgi:NADH:ubiquinone oxidoreductase subunit 5 (subunit L)/multisubunit Na+/H+ antiporter MnhA subunit
MPDISLITILGLAVLVLPAALLAALGLSSLLDRPLAERTTTRLVQWTMLIGFLAAAGVLALMLLTGTRHVPISLGNWVHTDGFHFSLKFVFDRLSVPLVMLTFLLCGVIGGFASRYLHREPGFNRFFVFFAVFALGMVITSLAGTIEALFAGWELVGISSALLVAFFHERTAPVRNGLRVWAVYRVSDAALLIAAVVMHHLHGEGDFSALLGAGPWPEGQAVVTAQQALIVGLLLLVAAAGKSALVPFSGWLPRAMEGPTPSSAVFYGALSVHLGAYLLLRVSPLLDLSPVLSVLVVVVGLATAVFAALSARVQTDIKSALSFASLTQVGIIVAEIGLGLRYIALIHILGHACLRTLQFVRASSVLQDYHVLENAIGSRLPTGPGPLPLRYRGAGAWLYRLAIERGYFDAWLSDYVARPVLRLFQTCDGLERRWTDFLAGGASRESDRLSPAAGSLEDLA